MKKTEINFTYEVISNVPPGEIIPLRLESPVSNWVMGQKTYRFAKRCWNDPALRQAIREKAAQLEAEGFFAKHPPKAVPEDDF